MKCPHCLTSFHHNPARQQLGEDSTSDWELISDRCPECGRFIYWLFERYNRYRAGNTNYYHYKRTHLVYPKGISRAPVSSDVPTDFAADYNEACLTLADSPKASAALSRRCLQHILREKANVKHRSLADEIQELLDRSTLPSHLSESLDAVRNIGNFAAHPIKSTSTGEVVEVEPGEAEWNLDVIEGLFDYYFVQPAITKRKRDALNQKLQDVGKPDLKQ